MIHPRARGSPGSPLAPEPDACGHLPRHCGGSVARRRLRVADYRNILDESRAHCSARRIQDKGTGEPEHGQGHHRQGEAAGLAGPGEPPALAGRDRGSAGRGPPVPVQVSTVEPCRYKMEAWVRAEHTPRQFLGARKRETAFSGSLGRSSAS
jgi:hypothetical protein